MRVHRSFLNSCSLIAVLAIQLLLPVTSSADVIYHKGPIPDFPVPCVNLAGDVNGTWDDLWFSVAQVNTFVGPGGQEVWVGKLHNGYPYPWLAPDGCTAGTVVNDSQSYCEWSTLAYYQDGTLPQEWVHRYIGLKLIDGGGKTHFGWAQFSWVQDPGVPYEDLMLQLDEWAYESTAGVPITITPEPASLLLLSLGGLGLVKRRR
jgi:hypothetical protein